jgi:hypothetical protein
VNDGRNQNQITLNFPQPLLRRKNKSKIRKSGVQKEQRGCLRFRLKSGEKKKERKEEGKEMPVKIASERGSEKREEDERVGVKK